MWRRSLWAPGTAPSYHGPELTLSRVPLPDRTANAKLGKWELRRDRDLSALIIEGTSAWRERLV